MREGPQTHRIQQQPALAAGRAGGPGARVAVPSGPSASGDHTAMAALERDLLLLPEDLDLGGGEAKRGVGDGGCYGHLVPAETCSSQRRGGGSAGQSGCGETGRTEVHDDGDKPAERNEQQGRSSDGGPDQGSKQRELASV